MMGTVGFFIFGILLIVRPDPRHFDVRDARNPRAPRRAAMTTARRQLRLRSQAGARPCPACAASARSKPIRRRRWKTISRRRSLPLVVLVAGLLGIGVRLRHAGLCQHHRLSRRHRRPPRILLAGFRSDRVRDRRPVRDARRLLRLPGRQPSAAALRPGRRSDR